MAEISAAVKQASREQVIQAAARFGVATNIFPFLDSGNPCVTEDSTNWIEQRLNADPSALDLKYFCDFLALSSTLHLLEGWAYISKAAYALLAGSRSTSVHLSYYAELRAARSLLAASGIFIGNRRHFAVSADGRAIELEAKGSTHKSSLRRQWETAIEKVVDRMGWMLTGVRYHKEKLTFGTHLVAWQALKAWAYDPQNGNLLASSLSALNFDGIDWAEACRGTRTKSDVMAHWLRSWSTDLHTYASDKGLREFASYGIDLKPSGFASLTSDEYDLVLEANRSCLFQGAGNVDEMDLMLLNDFCFKTYRGRLTQVNNRRDHRIWDGIKDWLINSRGISDPDATSLVHLIRNAPRSAAGRLVTRAKKENTKADGVFSRGYLLLRLATELHRWLWTQIALVSRHRRARDWQTAILNMYAMKSNLLKQSELPANFADMEVDVQDAINDAENWKNAHPFSSRDFWLAQPSALMNLCRFERFLLWESTP